MILDLTMPQYIYLAVVVCYAVFFGLFLRLFWWKRFADRNFWNRRPQLTAEGLLERAKAVGHSLPRFSIVVPARNEADVIERTVDHMNSLEYPPDLYEVVVVTDEKEALAAERGRAAATHIAAAAIVDHRYDMPKLAPETHAGGLVLGMLGALSLEALDEAHRRWDGSEGVPLLRTIPTPLLHPLIWEASCRLLDRSGKRVSHVIMRLVRTRLPQADDEQLQSAYAALLSLAIPTAVAFVSLRGGDGRALSRKLAAFAAQAHHTLTREIIQAMCETLAHDLATRLEAAGQPPDLTDRLSALYRELFPTTQDIMERKLREVAGVAALPSLKHVVVPRNFDGELGGQCLTVDVVSTKGRALNWALSYVDGRSSWYAFYDAESRPDKRAMLYVAHRVLQSKVDGDPAPRIFQGPVFQVRNWYEMGPICKVASLFQSIAHDWCLPVLFRRLPFVGGTNLYTEAQLLRSIGAYDYHTLTEDLELGTRAYLAAGAWPEYLPYPSSEQTPPTFRGFYRQRLRWATGHLQVMAKIREAKGYDPVLKQRLLRTLWWKGQGEWIIYQGMTLIPPFVSLLWFMGWVDPSVLSNPWRVGMNFLSTVHIGFIIYVFFRYLEYLDPSSRPRKWMGQVAALAQLLVLPLVAFLLPVPYSSALVLSGLRRGPSHWEKTPRTKE